MVIPFPKRGLIQPKVGMGMVLVQKSEDGTNWFDTLPL